MHALFSGGILSVPISKPLYTCIESQLMISPLRCSASLIAMSLFPTAVGPTTMTRFLASDSNFDQENQCNQSQKNQKGQYLFSP
jgi:hypothetical protein